jgi:heme-degrading monooxygenase HmoA
MIVTIFRSRLRAEHQNEYAEWAERIHQLATTMPGFLSIKTFTPDDGERVAIVEFASEETHRAWRDHPQHLVAQELGRRKFYAEYRIQVCQDVKMREFRAGELAAPSPTSPKSFSGG